jgi:hypothetical protein
MNDTLDDLLREHGRQWAQAQSAPPALDDAIANATAPPSRRPWLAVAAAVVAVAGVAAIPIARSVGHAGSSHHQVAAATSKPTAATETAATTATTATPSPDPALGRLNDEAVALAKDSGLSNATGQAVRTTFADAVPVHPDWVRDPAPAGTTPVWVIEVRAGNDSAVGETLATDNYQTYAVVLARAPYDISSLGDVIELPMS